MNHCDVNSIYYRKHFEPRVSNHCYLNSLDCGATSRGNSSRLKSLMNPARWLWLYRRHRLFARRPGFVLSYT